MEQPALGGTAGPHWGGDGPRHRPSGQVAALVGRVRARHRRTALPQRPAALCSPRPFVLWCPRLRVMHALSLPSFSVMRRSHATTGFSRQTAGRASNAVGAGTVEWESGGLPSGVQVPEEGDRRNERKDARPSWPRACSRASGRVSHHRKDGGAGIRRVTASPASWQGGCRRWWRWLVRAELVARTAGWAGRRVHATRTAASSRAARP